ncbi:MAG: CXXX repeat peptide maturase [Alloprevotella sp.]|nr:CXXX repeat peptide maturase [Alloprevotella sp.]
MLQYLIILLDDTATSYCHYPVSKTGQRPIPVEVLRRGIRFAMTENLMIQFVFPDCSLPEDVLQEVETIDHGKIMPIVSPYAAQADVLVCEALEALPAEANVPVVLRTKLADFFANHESLTATLSAVPRLNIVFTDVENFSDKELQDYQVALAALAQDVEHLYVEGQAPQLNLLTDRMMLKSMNNCGAGDTTLTLAPDGRFYVCPAYYGKGESVGDLDGGINILNPQLYRCDHAPLCRRCDAYQCKRCMWLNERLTLEVNTPSHQQCVMAHVERNVARGLLSNIRKHGTFLPEMPEIKEIDYFDPFDVKEER